MARHGHPWSKFNGCSGVECSQLGIPAFFWSVRISLFWHKKHQQNATPLLLCVGNLAPIFPVPGATIGTLRAVARDWAKFRDIERQGRPSCQASSSRLVYVNLCHLSSWEGLTNHLSHPPHPSPSHPNLPMISARRFNRYHRCHRVVTSPSRTRILDPFQKLLLMVRKSHSQPPAMYKTL